MQNLNSSARSIDYELARGGGGYGSQRYVDCNSALAVIGFILFVDILRDFIESVVEKEAKAERKKRWAVGDDVITNFWHLPEEEEPDVLTFIQEDGPQHLYRSLPKLFTSVLEGWLNRNQTGHPTQCLQQSICQANFELARNYGAAGRIVATLFSNVAGHALQGPEEEGLLEATLRAARTGRRRNSCLQAYPECLAHSTL
ncbi:uncharacterized protein [Palaemon carinicauda]|uniref:uncharacterized protein n=1 Tax=Palaemon carinicauda TaxID=392227 RepID=UPI0035B59F1A